MNDIIKHLQDKHFNQDRKWRYNLEEGRFRTLDELIERRELPKYEDYLIKKADVDQRVLEQARAMERKLKRLRMAKYSLDLFDEIVGEMLKDKKSFMEIMADLDVEE